MKNLELVYIAAPYLHKNKMVMQLRHEIINNICTKIIAKYNYSIFSPISHGHNIPVTLSDQAELVGYNVVDYWMEVDLKILTNCSNMFVLMIDGWRESEGVLREIKFCKEHSIEVSFIDVAELIGVSEVIAIERAIINSETNLNIIQHVVGEFDTEHSPQHNADDILNKIKYGVANLQSHELACMDKLLVAHKKEIANVGLDILSYCHKIGLNLGKEMVKQFRDTAL